MITQSEFLLIVLISIISIFNIILWKRCDTLRYINNENQEYIKKLEEWYINNTNNEPEKYTEIVNCKNANWMRKQQKRGL